MSKSSMAEVYSRVETIAELLTRGYYRKEIIQYGAKWQLKNRQIDKYIAMATKLIKKQQSKDFDLKFAKAEKRLDQLYIKALDNEDLGLARAINKDYIDLTGVKAPEKIDHTTQGEKITDTIDYSKLDTETLLKIQQAKV